MAISVHMYKYIIVKKICLIVWVAESQTHGIYLWLFVYSTTALQYVLATDANRPEKKDQL